MKETNRPLRIGVFIEWLSDGYSDPILDEIACAAEERGVDVRCFVGRCDEHDFPVMRRHMPAAYASSATIDGAVIVSMGTGATAEELERYFERFAPMPLCSVAVQWDRYPSVEVDNETGVRAGLRHLIRTHGRRRIACIRGPSTSIEAEKRFTAYREVLAERGLAYDERLVTSGWYIREHGVEAVRFLLDERKVEFDAIVAANDAMALGALEELERRAIPVPDAVALLGFDDIDEGRHARPPLSTVRQPVREHGRRAFEIVLAQLDGLQVPQKTLIDSHLVLRRSCGCITTRGGMTSSAPPPVVTLQGPDDVEQWVVACCRALSEFFAPRTGTEPLTQRLARAMINGATLGDSRAFLALVEYQLERIGRHRGDVLSALPLLESKRREIRGAVGVGAEREMLDNLLRETQAVTCEMAESAQAQLRYRAETQINRLLRMNEEILQTLDFVQLSRVIAGQLQSLGIGGCYVCIWEGAEVPAEWARLVVACEPGKAHELPPDGKRFAAKEILPAGYVSERTASTWLVCPMLRREEIITAYVVIVRGTAEAFVCDSLLDQIGSSFKRLALMEQVVAEARLREAAERERIEKEMRIASQIQTGILPQRIDVTGLEISCSMRPATEVGGDYYDVIAVDDGCWIGIGDVAGHGLPTGLVMLMCQSVIGGLVRSQPDAPPEQLLSVANQLLHDNIRCRMRQDEHITLALIHCSANGQLHFAGAHESIVIWRAAQRRLEQLEFHGVWTGILEDITPMTTGEYATLHPGDLLILYTDGITEARNGLGEVFGEQRLGAAICELHDAAVDAIRERILERVDAWMARQEDDMTLVVARYLGSDGL